MKVKISKALVIRAAVVLVPLVLLLWAIMTLSDFSPHSAVGATWDNITVGVSNKKQVHTQLGQPDSGGVLLQYYYHHLDNTPVGSEPYLTIRYDLLHRVNFIHVDFMEWKPTHFSEFIEEYGDPDYTAWGTSGLFAMIYLDDGIVLHVAPNYDHKPELVTDAYFFLPCSLACVQRMPFFNGLLVSALEPYQH